MSTPKPKRSATVVPIDAREVALQHGRRLTAAAVGADDVIEICGQGGAVELRIRLTPEGPVLQLEGVRLSLKAAEAIDVECATFNVRARDAVDLRSEGAVRVHADTGVEVDATGDVRVSGKLIHLN
jgi:phage gp45-like